MKSFWNRVSFVVALIGGIAVSNAADTIKIGYIPSLTGGFANDSVGEIRMVKLAEKQVNAAGGVNGKKIEVVIVDNKSTPQDALAAFNQVVEKEKVVAVLTNSKTVQIVALAIASKNAKLAVVMGGSSPKLTDDPDNMYIRTRPDDNTMAAGVIQFIQEDTKYRKIGIVHDSAINGASMANNQEKYASALKELKIVARSKYETNASNLKEQFEAMKKAGADVVVGNVATAADGALAYKTAKEYNFKYISSPAGARLPALQGAGAAANGAWVATEFVAGTPEIQKIATEFKAEYNEELDPFALWIYDGFNLIIDGLKMSNGDGKGVKAAILKARNLKGTMRTFDFDSRGDGNRSINISKIENGNLSPVKTVDVKKK